MLRNTVQEGNRVVEKRDMRRIKRQNYHHCCGNHPKDQADPRTDGSAVRHFLGNEQENQNTERKIDEIQHKRVETDDAAVGIEKSNNGQHT